jgi:hypothetical protein
MLTEGEALSEAGSPGYLFSLVSQSFSSFVLGWDGGCRFARMDEDFKRRRGGSLVLTTRKNGRGRRTTTIGRRRQADTHAARASPSFHRLACDLLTRGGCGNWSRQGFWRGRWGRCRLDWSWRRCRHRCAFGFGRRRRTRFRLAATRFGVMMGRTGGGVAGFFERVARFL